MTPLEVCSPMMICYTPSCIWIFFSQDTCITATCSISPNTPRIVKLLVMLKVIFVPNIKIVCFKVSVKFEIFSFVK